MTDARFARQVLPRRPGQAPGDGETPASPPRGETPWWRWPGRIVPGPIAMAVVLGVAAALLGSRQINDDFKPVYVAADLAHPERFLADASLVGPSDMGMLEWRARGALVVPSVVVRAGDRLKAQVLAECGQGVLTIRAGDGEAVSVPLGPGWQSVDVTMPAAGTGLRLEKRVPAPCPVHLSRLSMANFHGEMTGLFEAHLVRLRPSQPALDWLRLLLLAIAPLVVIVAAWAWQRHIVGASRRRAWRVAAGCALLPVALLLAFEVYGAVRHLWPVMPGRSFAVLFALPVAILVGVWAGRLAWRVARRLPRFVTGAGAWMWRIWMDIAAGNDRETQPGSASVLLRPGHVALAALALYGAFLWFVRPATPFEWDEVLYQRALDHYDVAKHSPHPPGVPAYIAVAKAVSVVVRDPHLALQLVAIVSALLAAVLLFRLGRALGALGGAAAAAACVLGFIPGFTFHGNIGLSDVPAAAGILGAALACVAATRDTRLLPLSAAVVALALSVRPQILVSLLPVGVAVIVMAVRRRRWLLLGLGALSGLVVTALIWVPAIALTGFGRYRQAIVDHANYVATVEAATRLPAIGWSVALSHWLVDPLGSVQTAVAFWVLVVLGAVAWLATGRRWLVAVASASGCLYLGVAMFSMNVLLAARYSLPAMTFFSLLAAGVAAAPWRWLRAVGVGALGLWCVAALAWGLPVYLLRRDPAPVWSALTWVRDRCDTRRTTVIFDGAYRPHVKYLLERAGFRTVEKNTAEADGTLARGGRDTVIVTAYPMPGCEVLFEKEWDAPRLGQLTYRRYGSCAVNRLRPASAPLFSPEWQVRDNGWQLWGTGRIGLPVQSKPAVVRICAGRETITLRRPGGPIETIAPGQCAMVPLLPGPGSELAVIAPPNSATLIPPIQLLPLGALDVSAGLSAEYMVPQAAHLPGYRGAFWRTDLVVINPQNHSLRIAAQFLPTGRDNETAPLISTTLAPGQFLNVSDILSLPGFRESGNLGALLLYAMRGADGCEGESCDFYVHSRTYNSNTAQVSWRATEWLPGVAPTAALRLGEKAVFSHITRSDKVGASVGLASWSDAPVRVRLRVLDVGARLVENHELDLPPFGHQHLPLQTDLDNGSVEVELVGAPVGALIVPYASLVYRDTGLPTQLLPDVMPRHALSAGWRPSLPKPMSTK